MLLGARIAAWKPPYDAEVDWLATDGTAYIVTAFLPDDTCGFLCEYTPIAVRDQVVFGSRNSSGATRWFCNFGTTYIQTGWGNSGNVCAYSENQRYQLEVNYFNSRNAVSGEYTRALTETLPTFDYPAYILNANRYGSIGTFPTGKLHHAVFTRGSSIVHDFIPVVKNNVGYMYDKIEGKLYGNAASSGAFTWG